MSLKIRYMNADGTECLGGDACDGTCRQAPTGWTPAPGADQLDVVAEQRAVLAVNEARNAASCLAAFDAIAHEKGVMHPDALAALDNAKMYATSARTTAEDAGKLQAFANATRENERKGR